MSRKNPDHFYRKAKDSGYAARSVFKLEEIQKKIRVFHRGDTILDLGASPGSWLQFLSQEVGAKGKVVGVDLNPLRIEVPKNVIFHQSDIFSDEIREILEEYAPFDCLVSDMAPKTSGISDRDHFKSIELCSRALELSQKILRKGGAFLCKYFQGGEDKALEEEIKVYFSQIKRMKPDASRKRSRESFLLGLDKRR